MRLVLGIVLICSIGISVFVTSCQGRGGLSQDQSERQAQSLSWVIDSAVALLEEDIGVSLSGNGDGVFDFWGKDNVGWMKFGEYGVGPLPGVSWASAGVDSTSKLAFLLAPDADLDPDASIKVAPWAGDVRKGFVVPQPRCGFVYSLKSRQSWVPDVVASVKAVRAGASGSELAARGDFAVTVSGKCVIVVLMTSVVGRGWFKQLSGESVYDPEFVGPRVAVIPFDSEYPRLVEGKLMPGKPSWRDYSRAALHFFGGRVTDWDNRGAVVKKLNRVERKEGKFFFRDKYYLAGDVVSDGEELFFFAENGLVAAGDYGFEVVKL